MTENEQKQIKEMAREMCHLSEECESCRICNERYNGDDEDEPCYYQCIAKEIITHDYRKVERGEWKLGKSGCMYFCPKCNYAAHPREAEEWDFCPRCGADMRGDGNDT